MVVDLKDVRWDWGRFYAFERGGNALHAVCCWVGSLKANTLRHQVRDTGMADNHIG